jgi:hypothetical protein
LSKRAAADTATVVTGGIVVKAGIVAVRALRLQTHRARVAGVPQKAARRRDARRRRRIITP